ncbi:MAG: hypothetical protein CFK52_08015 [Chloracidobacterium sp. CP2_5A]|nr:MAG: hypothetical protein CFK52_08015 [Chloracidobacterium sp. CP2_5A]
MVADCQETCKRAGGGGTTLLPTQRYGGRAAQAAGSLVFNPLIGALPTGGVIAYGDASLASFLTALAILTAMAAVARVR